MSVAFSYGRNWARTCGCGRCCCGGGDDFWKNLENIVDDDDPKPRAFSFCSLLSLLPKFVFLLLIFCFFEVQVPCESPVWVTHHARMFLLPICLLKWTVMWGLKVGCLDRWISSFEGTLGTLGISLIACVGLLFALLFSFFFWYLH